MKKSPHTNIIARGVIGEYIAGKYLLDKGFKVGIFGGGDWGAKNKVIKKLNLKENKSPIVLEQEIGYPHKDKMWKKRPLTYGFMAVDRDNLDKFEKNLQGKDEVAQKSDFNFYHHNCTDDTFFWKENSKDKWLEFQDNKVSTTKENFFRLNLLTTYYTQSLWWNSKKYIRKYKLTEDDFLANHYRYDYVAYKKQEKEEESKTLFNRILDYFKNPTEVEETDSYYAIEVKVNSSKLNSGQIMRLGLLQKYGFNAQVINIIINDAQVDNAINNGIYECDDIIIKDDFGLSKLKIFNIEDFKETIKKAFNFRKNGYFPN
tara:strand:- start:34 stop:981 length:948 start_codon:yes stop_codon:yes gene_type:complete